MQTRPLTSDLTVEAFSKLGEGSVLVTNDRDLKEAVVVFANRILDRLTGEKMTWEVILSNGENLLVSRRDNYLLKIGEEPVPIITFDPASPLPSYSETLAVFYRGDQGMRLHYAPVCVPIEGMAPLTPDMKGTLLACEPTLWDEGSNEWTAYEALIPLDDLPGLHLRVSVSPGSQPPLAITVVADSLDELRITLQNDLQGWRVVTGSDDQPMNHLGLVVDGAGFVAAPGYEREDYCLECGGSNKHLPGCSGELDRLPEAA